MPYGTLRLLTEQGGKEERSFARIFRQNMFNCGILAVELAKADIDRLFSLTGNSGGAASALMERVNKNRKGVSFFKLTP